MRYPICLLALSSLGGVWPVLDSQELFSSPRVAAQQFALAAFREAGFNVPTDSMVFVREFYPADGDETATRNIRTESASLIRDAASIVERFGPNARAGSALDYLQCGAHSCFTSTRYSVVVAGEANVTGTASVFGVLVILHEPAHLATENRRSRTLGAVYLTRIGDKWRADSLGRLGITRVVERPSGGNRPAPILTPVGEVHPSGWHARP